MHDTFGDLLSAYVRQRGMTMAEFAAVVGLNPSSLSRVRTGQRLPAERQLQRWCDALQLGADERSRLHELLLLARTPAEVRAKLAQAEQRASAEHDRRSQVEEGFGRFRRDQGWHDGWWLTFSSSFQNDGSVQRSLLRIAGDHAELQVRELGRLHYSYHGTVEILSDKVFARLTEDRGSVEHVQIILDSLFDYREPSFLYGLVCGISGKDIQHPVSWPACSRLLVMHIGRETEFPADGETMQRVFSILGRFAPGTMRQVWPTFLGNADWLSQCLRLGDESLDQAILRLVDSRPRDGEHVLRAILG